MRTSDFDYLLPASQIATHPAERRDGARLMRVDRVAGTHNHAYFREIGALLPPRSLIVLNDTRVIPARLRGHKPSSGSVELLLTRLVHGPIAGGDSGQDPGQDPRQDPRQDTAEIWEGLAKNVTKNAGHDRPLTLRFSGGLEGTVLENLGGGRVLIRFDTPGPGGVLARLEEIGEIPLPPYIEAARKLDASLPSTDDRARYQTVYATAGGAVAAPTAGLHFTAALLQDLVAAGHQIVRLTLHVGPGTFRPVKVDRPAEHVMDEERFEIPEDTARAVNVARAAGQPVVAVGTTVVRALEGAARAGAGQVRSGPGSTALFLLPGDQFQVVSDLITNFHLPRSTLLMLVAAFAGRERILGAYQEAIAQGYRFYSYGDAMLITGRPSP